MRISSNLSSLTAQRSFHKTERDVERALRELATGSRLVDPGADPAGLAISQQLDAQNRGYKAALENAENASSFVQVAEGSMSEQSNILIRLRELAVQSASDTMSDVERGFLNDEVQQLTAEFDRIARSTKFGSQGLLDGSTKTYEFQVGVNKGADNVIEFTSDTDTTASNLDIDGLSVEDKGDARDALETLDEALVSLNGSRAKLGAIQSRLDSASNHIGTQVENISSAVSRMADADIPDAVGRVRKGQILAQYQAVAMQAANDSMGAYLKLIA